MLRVAIHIGVQLKQLAVDLINSAFMETLSGRLGRDQSCQTIPRHWMKVRRQKAI